MHIHVIFVRARRGLPGRAAKQALPGQLGCKVKQAQHESPDQLDYRAQQELLDQLGRKAQ